MKKLIIAIDGYSGCGKSTLAKALADILDYTYIDSGAMYRAVTLFCLNAGLIKNGIPEEKKVIEVLEQISLEFRKENNTRYIYMNDVKVEKQIRTIHVANNVSKISQIPEVRSKLVSIQRSMGVNKAVVMDGRDIGTVVFPDADLKIFMTADVNTRAQRRYDETNDSSVSLDDIIENIKNRDFQDENREISPLRKAEDAIVLDNSKMSKQEQLDFVLNLAKKRMSI